MQEKHQLKLAEIRWDFIKDYPAMTEGILVCKEFIDGILYPQSIGEGMTHQAFLAEMKKIFIQNGLSLSKCDSKKMQY
jgi:hypothetical protein